METKHTKGKWEINKNLSDIWIEITPVGGNLPLASARPHYKEFEANAKLIASAPELLEALVNIKSQLSVFDEMDLTTAEKAIIGYCNQAIKKATE